MGALSDLLKQPQGAATPATPATQPAARVRSIAGVAESQESQGCAPEMRVHLLSLADAEGYAQAIVHRLRADDVAACVGLSDDTLRAYLRALDRRALMDRGMVPNSYTQAVHCEGCGPVWLWQGAPKHVRGCPWCHRGNAATPLPRPLVTCGSCAHYRPDPLNKQAGMGGCALGAARAYWPMRRHCCADHAAIDNRPEQGDRLTISHSVETQR